MKRLVLLSISMLLIFFCEFKGNIYNPGDSAYKQPSFTLDTSSNVSDGDTILTDTLRMVLIGNDKERHYNLFRYSLDGSSWTKWKGKGEKEYVIEHSPITGGFHTVTIEYCYPDQEDRAKDSTITFFRAVKPEITEMTDTLFDVELGVSCTLRVAAQGTGDLGYEWFCDNNRIDSATSDSLFLNPVFVEDTAHRWYCSISNNWGEITSPEIRLQILLRVFYDGNGNTSGEVPEDTGRYAINGLVEIPGNPGKLTRRGYTFKGWNTEEDGSGVSPDSGLMLKIGTENITLYARWQPNDSFTVTYDGNGAQEGEVPETERYYKTGELVTVAGNSGDLRREGYTFIGWNTLANDSGKGYLEGDTFEMGEKTVILYAQWTSNPAWKVTYDANGAESGNVPEDENKYEEGDTVTVAFNSGNLEKEGNIFVGWSTQTDGDKEPFFTPGATFLMGTDDVKLYACWTTKPTFKLIYDGNGNTGGSSPHTVSQEEGKTVNIAGSGELFKKGYNFSGWNTKADGTGKEYNENDSYTMPAKHDTLYAQWEKKLYTVTYDGNGDNVDNVPQSTNHLYDTEITLDTKVPVRTGYTFFRWNTDSSGNGVDYNPGDKFTIKDNNAKFYAKWTVNEYSITYDGNCNDGEVFLNTVETDYNESVTIAGKGDLQKTGHSFTGWNTKADGSGITYPADTIIIMGTDDITLYAEWILNEYDVIYEGNGSTSGSVPAEKWKYEDNVVVAAKENLVRTGYTFIGWNTEANGSGTAYTPGEKFKMGAGPVTLYAQWQNPSGMVRIDAKGKTFFMGSNNGYGNESPVHQVTFTKDFWMDTTEVTQGEYENLMTKTYSGYPVPLWNSTDGIGNNHPAYSVSWYDAVLYCNARTKATGSSDTVYTYTSIEGISKNHWVLNELSIDLGKNGFRLPTEAQWEYACRAGTTTDFCWGKNYDPYPSSAADSTEIDGYATWYNNSNGNEYGTHPVGTREKNNFGLYDMSGNVWEWCNDWFENYTSDQQTDPVGPENGSYRMMRGGSWTSGAFSLRSASRNYNSSNYRYSDNGFRVCLPAQ